MTSMAYNAAAGLSSMLKDGHRHLEGVDDATLRNVEAAAGLAAIVRSSLGPNGMNKLVINHLDKSIVTSDCATIVRELEIEHPAARMLSQAADAQDKECGDGTNLVVSFAGGLLDRTRDLLRTGLHVSDVAAGYRVAGEELAKALPTTTAATIDARDRADLLRVVRPVVGAKQYGHANVLAPLVVDACARVMTNRDDPTKRPSVAAENVRVAKILGGDVAKSRVVNGMVVLRGVETSVTKSTNVRVTVFGCGVEASATEAKGTVLMENAEDLKGYNKSEERKMEEIIKSIADTGTKLIVSGGTVSEMALHFMERYGLMCLKVPSKWELRRLCAATNSTALVRLGPATEEEIGTCDHVRVEEIGGRKVTVLEQDVGSNKSRLATILLRAATSSVLQDLERAVDDGVRCVSVACRDGRAVPGAGAAETTLSAIVADVADRRPGLDQYAVRAFAKTLEAIPRTLAESAGHRDPSATVAALAAAHARGRTTMGVNVENGDDADGGTDDVVRNVVRGTNDANDVAAEEEVLDLLATKTSAFQLAVDTAITVLRVDQIIMSKQAGVGGRK